MRSDIEIARDAPVRPIIDVAIESGLNPDEVELHGHHKAKISLSAIGRLSERPNGKYIDVTAITPTPLGEGKTLTTVGLGQALGRVGKRAVTCIRQPSLGPVFGIKGGAAGGGYSQVIPMEEFNLHLTGDFHAVSAAHNLCAAFLDNSIYQGNPLDIDPYSVVWRRVVDISDRALRDVVIGLGGRMNGIPRESGWDITSASELMAILALAEDLGDLRERVGRIVVATNRSGEPVTTQDLGVAGAMTVLLKEAVKPTLVQNLEGGPVLVHAGPFANIAHGNSSIIADRLALKMGEYVVTESGFGADMGFEKFVNIKCRTSGLAPDCVVLVATVRGLKAHAPGVEVKSGRPLPDVLTSENLEALEYGIPNLTKHIQNTIAFGVPVVVALNAFPTDTLREQQRVLEAAVDAGAFDAVVHTLHAEGGAGGRDLADAVVAACEQPADLHFSYAPSDPIAMKIVQLAVGVYGAEGVEFSPVARSEMERYADWGFSELPICMAKTQLSLSDDPSLKGAPSGWTLYVRDIRLSAGAGFLYALCGTMMTMPGLPASPAGTQIDIDADGTIHGLF